MLSKTLLGARSPDAFADVLGYCRMQQFFELVMF